MFSVVWFCDIGILVVAQVNTLASLSKPDLETMNYPVIFQQICFLLMSARVCFCCSLIKLTHTGCIPKFLLIIAFWNPVCGLWLIHI